MFKNMWENRKQAQSVYWTLQQKAGILPALLRGHSVPWFGWRLLKNDKICCSRAPGCAALLFARCCRYLCHLLWLPLPVQYLSPILCIFWNSAAHVAGHLWICLNCFFLEQIIQWSAQKAFKGWICFVLHLWAPSLAAEILWGDLSLGAGFPLQCLDVPAS